MEKLIELLNEWSKTALESKCNWIDVYDEEWVYFLNLFDRDMTMEIEDVISKRNWFIQRLVENDKIDYEPIMKKEIWYWRKVWEVRGYETFNLENALLILLAISDIPIEDLISHLK